MPNQAQNFVQCVELVRMVDRIQVAKYTYGQRKEREWETVYGRSLTLLKCMYGRYDRAVWYERSDMKGYKCQNDVTEVSPCVRVQYRPAPMIL